MKSLRKVLLSVFIACSFAAASTSALAFEEGRTVYTPAAAIDGTIEKIINALAVMDGGAEAQEATDAISAAIQMNKEINANDKVDISRQRGAGHLKKARSAARKGELQPAEEHLRKALKVYESLKGKL